MEFSTNTQKQSTEDQEMRIEHTECLPEKEVNSDTSSDSEIEDIMNHKPTRASQIAMEQDETMSQATKTKNEINEDDIDQIQKFWPKLIGSVGNIQEIGRVKSFVNNRLVVSKSLNCETLDLDNFVTNEAKQVLGFVEDVIGPVTEPLYLICLY